MEYKEFAIKLAKQAGKIIKDNFTSNMKKEWKSDNTPVTETDLKINQLVIDAVKKHFPTHSIIAEEGSYKVDNSEYSWVCDPVDGTIPFSHGIPTCAFSLALVKNGAPILGVIYDPFIDRLFFAEKGKGAFLNNKKIHVSTTSDFDKSLIGLTAGKKDSLEIFEKLTDLKARVVGHWSIVYPGMLVATGDLIATIGRKLSVWDVAALKIIVEEAGGKVTSLLGEEQRYDGEIKGCLITNGEVHNKIVETIKGHPTYAKEGRY